MRGHDFYPRSMLNWGAMVLQMIFMHLIILDSQNFTFRSKHFMKMGDVG